MKAHQSIIIFAAMVLGTIGTALAQGDNSKEMEYSRTISNNNHDQILIYETPYMSNAELAVLLEDHTRVPMELVIVYTEKRNHTSTITLKRLSENVVFRVVTAPGTTRYKLDMSDFEENIYLLEISDNQGGKQTFEVIKMGD